MISPLVELQEARLGGAAFWTAEPQTVGPLIGGLLNRPDVGLDQSQLGADSKLDMVFVTCPIDGLQPETTFLAGQVVFSGDARFADLADMQTADPVLLLRFKEARCWAIVVQAASTDWKTTAHGLRVIDSTLAWLMTVHRLGVSAVGVDHALPYDRRWVRSRPTRRGITLTCGDRTGNRHLSGGVLPVDGPVLTDRSSMQLPTLPGQLGDERLLEGLLAWRRSVESDNRFTACSALCEAIECLVADVSVAKEFSRSDRKQLMTAIPDGLSASKRERVIKVLGWLNEPSLMMKIQTFLSSSGVETPQADLDSFAAVRGARNDLVHGCGNTSVAWSDLQRAQSWVASLLTLAIQQAPPDPASALGLIRVSQVPIVRRTP